MTTLPTFKHEIQYWQQKIKLIAGIDEVGMGALAGPVCAAAVIFTDKIKNITDKPVIRDSKTLSAAQREKATTWIHSNALAWAVGEANVDEIDKLNIRQASHLAMRRAVSTLKELPDLLLIDGTPVQLHDKIPAINIIGGDKECYSIAAASILAKVYRDNIMIELDNKFSGYGWFSNKGYGSQVHMTALNNLGANKHHRRSYAPVARVIEKSK
jgi:ribonuclease HII